MAVVGVLVTFNTWQDKVPDSCLAGVQPCARQVAGLLIWYLALGK